MRILIALLLLAGIASSAVPVPLSGTAWSTVQALDRANPGITGWMPTATPIADLGPHFSGLRAVVQTANGSLSATATTFLEESNPIPSVGNATGKNLTIINSTSGGMT